MSRPTPTILLILDGWGMAPDGPGNAFSLASAPTLKRLLQGPSCTTLTCSGRAVGLPENTMGNSEVGHLNIGAGRIVYQDITTIDLAIETNSFASNPIITETIGTAKRNGKTLHLIGLLSDGGVHSHIRHLLALIQTAKDQNVRTALHIITDGRDTDPHSGLGFLEQVLKCCDTNTFVASISGRYYAMDRDKHWERLAPYWDCIIGGTAPRFSSASEALKQYYSQKLTDEFIPPSLITQKDNTICTLQDGDAVFLFNFRADRMRQFAHCLSAEEMPAEGSKIKGPKLGIVASMTQYESSLPLPVAFPPKNIVDTLGEAISRYNLKQLRLAETEKYAHVTYFFNGGKEEPFPGEDRKLIPSPRDVATYDEKPQMSAKKVTQYLLEQWYEHAYDFYVCNFANMDMVGHTGVLPAAIKACECVDHCVQEILEAVQAAKGRVVITADHGNAEEMLTPEGTPQTSHSKNPVAFIVVDPERSPRLKATGKLGDIAPTLLQLMGIAQPTAMTGQSLLEE